MKTIMSDAWFKVERTGLAAKPTGWQGWAVVLGYIAALVALTWLMILRHAETPENMQINLWFGAVILLTIGLLVIVRRKTEGRWAFERKRDNDVEE